MQKKYKKIIPMQRFSGTKIDFDVIKPGSQSRENPKGELVPFSELSVSGRIANAYNALKMADRMVNGK